jgi:hypothetical protein
MLYFITCSILNELLKYFNLYFQYLKPFVVVVIILTESGQIRKNHLLLIKLLKSIFYLIMYNREMCKKSKRERGLNLF